MVYKHHQKWRDWYPEDSSVFDDSELGLKERKQLKSMRKGRPIIPYTLEIECTSYWGNFEREFLGYAIGILDDCQMRIRHSSEERAMFWKEVFNKEPIDFRSSAEAYELHREYLLETFQDCDDWEQLTFYTIDWESERNILKIQLTKPLSAYWEEIIIPRMKAFFDKKVYKYLHKEDKLIGITLCDRKGNVVKEY